MDDAELDYFCILSWEHSFQPIRAGIFWDIVLWNFSEKDDVGGN